MKTNNNNLLFKFLEDYKYSEQGFNSNIYYNINPNEFLITEENVLLFEHLLDLLKKSSLNKLIKTKNNHISKQYKLNNMFAWDVQATSSIVKVIINLYGKMYIFKLGVKHVVDKDEKIIYPNQAFNAFIEELAKDGVNIYDYTIDNGKEIKEQIEKPLIEFMPNIIDETLENVHHIDFHNSYPAGLANTHPEFRPTIERLYNNRKNPESSLLYKAILVMSIGYMQSYKPKQGRFAEWAHLSRDAIKDNNMRVIYIATQLKNSGRKVLGFNTDGVWYQGDIYHGDFEGNKLGEWSNDHINCKFRAKSNGAYEFIENNTYHPVVRGLTKLDAIKSRDNWEWGDIYKSPVIYYEFNTETLTFIKEEE